MEFPGGVLIDKKPWERDEAAEETAQAIKAGAKTIFEASFLAGGLFARMDVFTQSPDGKGWKVIEVKKSSKIKEEHIEVVAIQGLVPEAAGLKVASFHIMQLNSECVYPNQKNLFVIEVVTSEVAAVLPDLRGKVGRLQKVADSNKEPKVTIGRHCDEAYTCAFHEHCWNWILSQKSTDSCISNSFY